MAGGGDDEVEVEDKPIGELFGQLIDEGKAYAERLRNEGNQVTYREFDSLIHGFVGFTGTISAAARAMDEIALATRQALS